MNVKRLSRMITGASLIMASSWVSWLITKTAGIESIGSVTITTFIGFVAGIIFFSGGRK